MNLPSKHYPSCNPGCIGESHYLEGEPPLPPYEHLDPDPLDVTDDGLHDPVPHFIGEFDCMPVSAACRECRRNRGYLVPVGKPAVPRAVIGWLLVSLAVVLLSALAAWLFWRGFGA